MEVKPYKNKLSFKNKLARTFWACIYWSLFRLSPNIYFDGWRIFLLKCFGANIGRNCKIKSSVKIWAPWNLICSDFVAIDSNVQIYNVDKIIIDTKVAISQRSFLCTASHNIYSKDNELITAPIHLKSFSWIASESFIGMGVTIGEGAVVGARAAVFKNVAPWTIVGGNPSKFIKERILKN